MGATSERDQEQCLLQQQINFTNKQIHFFNRHYLPQILEALHNNKITENDRSRIYNELTGILIGVENSLAEVEHPDELKTNNQIPDISEIKTLEEARVAIKESRSEFHRLKMQYQAETARNAKLKLENSEIMNEYCSSFSAIDNCIKELHQIFSSN